MTTSRRTRAALLWTVCAAAALAGCGSKPAAPTVATARTGAPSAEAVPSGSPSPANSDYDKALRYTRCMTANGVPTADPVVGTQLVTVNIMHAGESEATIDARNAAFAKCKQYLPTTWPVKQDAADTARTQAFAACIRQRGLDWPAPDANGDVSWPTDPGAMSTPEWNAAIQACRKYYDDPANNLPENK